MVSDLDFVLRGLAADGFADFALLSAWLLAAGFAAATLAGTDFDFAGAGLAFAGADFDFNGAASLEARGLTALDDFADAVLSAGAVFLAERPAADAVFFTMAMSRLGPWGWPRVGLGLFWLRRLAARHFKKSEGDSRASHE